MSDGLFYAQAPLLGLKSSFVENILRFNHITEADVIGKSIRYTYYKYYKVKYKHYIRLIAVLKRQELSSEVIFFVFKYLYEFNKC